MYFVLLHRDRLHLFKNFFLYLSSCLERSCVAGAIDRENIKLFSLPTNGDERYRGPVEYFSFGFLCLFIASKLITGKQLPD